MLEHSPGVEPPSWHAGTQVDKRVKDIHETYCVYAHSLGAKYRPPVARSNHCYRAKVVNEPFGGCVTIDVTSYLALVPKQIFTLLRVIITATVSVKQ